MHLWDVRSMSFPNKRALLVARRLTLLVDVHVNDSIPSEAENVSVVDGKVRHMLMEDGRRVRRVLHVYVSRFGYTT